MHIINYNDVPKIFTGFCFMNRFYLLSIPIKPYLRTYFRQGGISYPKWFCSNSILLLTDEQTDKRTDITRTTQNPTRTSEGLGRLKRGLTFNKS